MHDDGKPGVKPLAYNYGEKSGHYLFPLWSASNKRSVTFNEDATAVERDILNEDFSLLFFLYDYKREFGETPAHNYTRRRVLWRLMHYERLNGDSTLDIFPAITWDTKADGYRKASFLWRFFRYEKPADGNTKFDLLFIPILR